MRFLRAISRFIVGIVFILSGFLKAVDPMGGALKMDEYLGAFHLGFFDFMTVPAGILQAALEFVIGVAVLKGIKMKFFSAAALWFMVFFTLLTLYSAVFNPVQDCGCFGEAIRLTNWETFFKNIVLLGCSGLIYVQRSRFKPIALPFWENIYLGGYTVFILFISIYSLAYLPRIDFGTFRAGTDLINSVNTGEEMEYETTFIYSKGGESGEFTLDNIPDSTWTFVEAKTRLVKGAGPDSEAIHFVLKDYRGEYVTDAVINSEKPLFFVSVYDAEEIGRGALRRLFRMRDTLLANRVQFYILSGNSPEQMRQTFGINDTVRRIPAVPETEILYTDYKTVLSFNRSNAGLVYINDGVVVDKWSKYDYPYGNIRRILSRDPEIVTANVIIKEQLFAEISIAFILLMILLIRFISKRVYGHYLEHRKSPAEENGDAVSDQ